MHILLTDILTCPVCGPASGLILRSDEMRDRRIIEGALGCPNCERKYPVRGSVAFLDPDERIAGDTVAAADDVDPEAAIRMAALLGLNDARGFVLVAGPAAALAPGIAEITENVEIIADAMHSPAGTANRLQMGSRLPFCDGRLNGIWLSGETADEWLEEAARALHPIGRLVLEPAPADAATRIEAAGLKIAAEQNRTVLAVRS
jgi:uncharacterized protein YbaR (Trm112 family)